jgi:hypothetical protein
MSPHRKQPAFTPLCTFTADTIFATFAWTFFISALPFWFMRRARLRMSDFFLRAQE